MDPWTPRAPVCRAKGSCLLAEIIIRDAETPADFDMVRQLCWEYRSFLINLGPRETEVVGHYYPEAVYHDILATQETQYTAPVGATFVACMGEEIVGCGAFHTFAPGVAEIKRVFLRDQARGLGGGRKMMEALIARIREMGFERIYMDTGRPLTTARALYKKLGFRERGPYDQTPPDILDIIIFFDMEFRSP